MVLGGHSEDDNLIVFGTIVGFEGEWPTGQAVVHVNDGPYEHLWPDADESTRTAIDAVMQARAQSLSGSNENAST